MTHLDYAVVIGTAGTRIEASRDDDLTLIYSDVAMSHGTDKFLFDFTRNDYKILFGYKNNVENGIVNSRFNLNVTGNNQPKLPHINFYLTQGNPVFYNAQSQQPYDYEKGVRTFLPDVFQDCKKFLDFEIRNYVDIDPDQSSKFLKELEFTENDNVICFKTYNSFFIEGSQTKLTKGEKEKDEYITEDNALGVYELYSEAYYRLEHSAGIIKLHFLPQLEEYKNLYVIFGTFDGTITSKLKYNENSHLEDSLTCDRVFVFGTSGRFVTVQPMNSDTEVYSNDNDVKNALVNGGYTFATDGYIDFQPIPSMIENGKTFSTSIKVTVTGPRLDGFPDVNCYIKFGSIANYNVQNTEPNNYLVSSDGSTKDNMMLYIICGGAAVVVIILVLVISFVVVVLVISSVFVLIVFSIVVLPILVILVTLFADVKLVSSSLD